MVGMVMAVSTCCPQCGTEARVRSVPAEYAAGVSVARTDTRFSVNGGRYRGRSRSRSVRHTVLARYLAPPQALPSPVGFGVAAVAAAGLCVVLIVASTLSGSSDEGGWFLATVAGFSAVACALVAVHRQRRVQRDGALTAAARDLWQNMLYCMGCNSVFLRAGRAVVPAQRLHAALRTAAAKRLASTSAAWTSSAR